MHPQKKAKKRKLAKKKPATLTTARQRRSAAAKKKKRSKSTTGIEGGVGGGAIGSAGPPGTATGEAFYESTRRTIRQFKADVRQELKGIASDIKFLRSWDETLEERVLRLEQRAQATEEKVFGAALPATVSDEAPSDLPSDLPAADPLDENRPDEDPDAEARAEGEGMVAGQ